MNDLLQLRALCDAADQRAFVPLSGSDLTNQRTPGLVLQLIDVIQAAVERGLTEQVINVYGLRSACSWERIGRYIRFPGGGDAGAWFGVDFRFWNEYGSTPMWLVFHNTEFGRGEEVRAMSEKWLDEQEIPTARDHDRFGIGLHLVTGEEKEAVIRSVVDFFHQIAHRLSGLKPLTVSKPLPPEDREEN